jgi:uncharacterized protein YcaQ
MTFKRNNQPFGKINNQQMRQLWLESNFLRDAPVGELDVLGIIRKLGFVQLDSIQNASRAHHHILWSRNQNYREIMLDDMLKERQDVFEHFTHDASILPMEFYPMWNRQFKKLESQIKKSKYYDAEQGEKWQKNILQRIEKEGPLSTKDFESKIIGKKEMWARPPHKKALDYLWYSGALSTSHRVSFRKFYDLAEKVIPKVIKQQTLSEHEQIGWLCGNALARLGIGSLKEIRDFWQATDLKEVKSWTENNPETLTEIEWQDFEGKWQRAFAYKNIKKRVKQHVKPSSRMRIINPFDPAIRDRQRLKNIFGFDYKIEIFVPKAKRKWGYYVYPLLENDQFVGRIEIKADRKEGHLNVLHLWPEEGVKWTKTRQNKLEAELSRFADFIGAEQVNWISNSKETCV